MTNEGTGGGLRDALSQNPAAQRVMTEARNYAQARTRHLATSAVEKVGDLSGRLNDYADNGSPVMQKGAEKIAEGKSPMSAAASAAKTKVGEKVKGMFKKGGGGGGKKSVNITETIDVGVPRSVAYNQWTQFQEFTTFSKGLESVQQAEDNQLNWRAKIAFSSRSWESSIQEQIPDYKIAWTSKGSKGSVDGVVTFHELTPDLTRVIMQLVYHPQGFFEKTGNLWRAQGRRARLDLKGFSRFLMLQGQESGAWRGEIRDGEVVHGAEEDDERHQQDDERDQQDDERHQQHDDANRQPREQSSRSEHGRQRQQADDSNDKGQRRPAGSRQSSRSSAPRNRETAGSRS